MTDFRSDLVDLVEQAVDRAPRCRSCGEHNIVTSDERAVWVECSSRSRERGPFGRALAALIGHDRIRVYDLEELAA